MTGKSTICTKVFPIEKVDFDCYDFSTAGYMIVG